MRNLIFLLLPLFLIAACGDESNKDKNNEDETNNPLMTEFETPYNVPDFDAIKTEHYLPAIKAGMEKQNEIIEVIVSNTDAPTYENTIAAYDHSGLFLSRNSSVFHNLLSAH